EKHSLGFSVPGLDQCFQFVCLSLFRAKLFQVQLTTFPWGRKKALGRRRSNVISYCGLLVLAVKPVSTRRRSRISSPSLISFGITRISVRPDGNDTVPSETFCSRPCLIVPLRSCT